MEDFVLYRRTPIMIKTIPKGTLLFRLTNKSKNDTRGIPKKDGTRCILPNHNVFFYPNPFVGNIALYKFKDINLEHMAIYVLKNDVKVVWLLSPSKYTRSTRKTKRNFIKNCVTIKQGCVDKKMLRGLHAPYNPCFGDTFIKKYPDVVGMIGIAVGDSERTNQNYPLLPESQKKFFHFSQDANGTKSIPELILHPLKERPSKDVIVNENDKLENNYYLLHKYHLPEKIKELEKFMEKHAVYNPETFFFTYKQ